MAFRSRRLLNPGIWLRSLVPLLLVLWPTTGAPAPPRSPVPSPATQPPAAEPTTAAGHYREARRLYLARDYEGALGHFRRAHQLEPRDFLLFNIAVCLERLDRLAEEIGRAHV